MEPLLKVSALPLDPPTGLRDIRHLIRKHVRAPQQHPAFSVDVQRPPVHVAIDGELVPRSEERRVGKECRL